MNVLDRNVLDRKVGEIATSCPGATRVFREHKIDFCCGGERTLAEACNSRGVNAEAIGREIRALESAPRGGTDWTHRPLSELVGHLQSAFHEKHRRDLSELVRMASRVEHVHAAHPACPHGLADALKEVQIELDMHMRKEEQILFPMIARGMGALARGPISVMTTEHDEHGARLRAIEALTHDCVPPADACNTWRALYLGVRTLVDDVMEHIHLENNVLFPRALRLGVSAR